MTSIGGEAATTTDVFFFVILAMTTLSGLNVSTNLYAYNVKYIQDKEERWSSSLSMPVAESVDLTYFEYTEQQLLCSPALQHHTDERPVSLTQLVMCASHSKNVPVSGIQ